MKNVNYGEKLSLPDMPKREYFTFKHWSGKQNGEKFDFDVTIKKDEILKPI